MRYATTWSEWCGSVTSRALGSAIGVMLITSTAASLSILNAAAQEPASQPAASADRAALLQLAQLTVQKGFKNISLGDVCDRLHIGVNCKAYQLDAAIEPGESRQFGLPAGWHTSINVLVQPGGTNIVIADHDDRVGYAYLIGPDAGLHALTVGLSTSGDGRNWRWRPGLISDDTARRFTAEKAYWLAQIKAIQALPDRKD